MTELISKINNIQQRVDKIIDLGEKGLLERRELHTFRNEIQAEIQGFISDVDDENQRLFKKITSGWTNEPRPGYVNPGEARSFLATYIELLALIVRNSTGKDFMSEVYVPAGKVFDGRQYLQSLLSKASNEILIVDAYLSKDILPLLAYKVETAPSFTIRFLIGKKNKAKFDGFSSELPYFIKQFPLIKVECRIHDDLHDRFIVIDNDEVYAIGSSLDAIGEKGNSITKLTDVSSIEKHKNDMKLLWDSAV